MVSGCKVNSFLHNHQTNLEKSFKFLTFNHKKAQNRHQINTQYTKHSYFRCNRFKLHRVTNCTQKDIRAIVGQINGQYRQIRNQMRINEHYFSIFFHTKPLLFFVLPLTQAYIPLYGMPVASDASLVESYYATNSPSKVNCAIGELL